MDISQGVFTTKQQMTASTLVIINYWGSWQQERLCNIEWEKKIFPDKDLEGRGSSLISEYNVDRRLDPDALRQAGNMLMLDCLPKICSGNSSVQIYADCSVATLCAG